MAKFNRDLKLRKAITGYKQLRPLKGDSDTFSIQTNVEGTEADISNQAGEVVATPSASNLKALIERIKEGLVEFGVKFPMITITSDPFLGFEVQLIEFSLVPNSGSFKLVFDSEETADIAFNASASDVQSALRAIAGLESVLVSGNFSDGFSVDFRSVPGDLDNLTDADNTLEELQDVEQLIDFSAEPTSGSYKLSYDSVETTDLDFDDNAAAVEAALQAIEGLENVSVAGDNLVGFTVTFVGMTEAELLDFADNTLEDVATDPVVIAISDETPAPVAITIDVSEDTAGEE